MKAVSKAQKISILILGLIIFLHIGYLVFDKEDENLYYTSSVCDLTGATEIPCSGVTETFASSKTRLNSLEFVFTNIAEDKTGKIIVKILSDGDLIYQTNISLSNLNNWEWKKIFVNAEIAPDKTYSISLNASEDCSTIPSALVINNECSPEAISSYLGDEEIQGQLAIRYGYLGGPSIFDRICVASIWIWIFIGISFVILKSKRIMEIFIGIDERVRERINPNILYAFCQIIFSIIIMECSGIEFQAPTKVIFYLISVFSGVNNLKKRSYVHQLWETTTAKIVTVLLYLYAAFSLVGQRILIYPLTLKVTLAGLFVFLVAILWFEPVINSALYYLGRARYKIFSDVRMKTWQFMLVCILILVLPAAYNLVAFNPGISSPDTFSCMIESAKHINGATDWHPVFYCMVLRIIEEVWDSTYMVIFVQYFFWGYVCMEMLLYLRKKKFNETFLIVVAIFLGFNAGNYIHLDTIWKDIPYTLSAFWTIILLAKLSYDYEYYKGKWYIYLELIVALVGVSLYRQNGIVTFIIIAVLAAIVLRKNRKVLISILISGCLFFFVKGPLYSYYDVQSVEAGKYIGLSQDILGVYYAGGEVSEETLQMINIMTEFNNNEYTYTPTWSYQSYNLTVEMSEFIVNYIDTFLKNPITMTRAIVDRMDAVWDIYLGQDSVLGCVNYAGTMDGSTNGWNEYYPERQYTSVLSRASEISAYTANSQWISAIEWRAGLFTLFSFMAFVFLVLEKKIKNNVVLIAPAVGHILSLMLSTGWSDFRYFWPLNLINLAFVLFSVLCVGKGKDEETT